MPAPTRYDAPHTQLGELALLAKQRGLSFEEWWIEATRPRCCWRCRPARVTLQPDCPECGKRTQGPAPVVPTTADKPPGAVVWPSDSIDRRTSLAAIDESRDGWERAYTGQPPLKREEAIPKLFRALLEADRERDRGNDLEAAVA